MKRDMDLVRHILIETEQANEPIGLSDLVKPQWNDNTVAYHIQFMEHHGLLDCKVRRDFGGDVLDATVDGLTWDGCDYLDAIRDADIWSKTKKVVREAVGSTTMEVIKQAAIMVATSAIKSHLGIV